MNWVKKVRPMIYDAVYDLDGFIDRDRTTYSGVEVEYWLDCGLFTLKLKPIITSQKYDTTPMEKEYDNSTYFLMKIDDGTIGFLADVSLEEAKEKVFAINNVREKFRTCDLAISEFLKVKMEGDMLTLLRSCAEKVSE